MPKHEKPPKIEYQALWGASVGHRQSGYWRDKLEDFDHSILSEELFGQCRAIWLIINGVPQWRVK